MMRFYSSLVVVLFLLFNQDSIAQGSFTGQVVDQEGNSLVNVELVLDEIYFSTTSNNKGDFGFTRLKEGEYTLKAYYLGYKTFTAKINHPNKSPFKVVLEKQNLLLDDVLIQATRIAEDEPGTYSSVDKEDLKLLNMGQDLGYLLRQSPSLVTTSDAGAGVGYTGVRIRGSDATRVNVTINGIPLNDSESQGVFWVNMPDFASSIDNIQVQRGVGSSTNGAGAFGGSINVQTTTLNKEAYGEILNSFGSFNTWRNAVKFGTGLLNNRFAIDGRLSRISSDGYIDRASSNLLSGFLSAAYYGKKSILRANIFTGKEITYQAWNGVPEELLETNRTFNSYEYDNQVDNYQQTHYQLHFSQQLTPKINLSLAGHYTKGQGFYEQFKDGEDLEDYGLESSSFTQDENGDFVQITTSDLIRRKWLDNDFYGFTFSLKSKVGAYEGLVGGAWNKYVGDHFGEVIWAQDMGGGDIRHRYYDNTGDKMDFNIFYKVNYTLFKKLNLFADLQFRAIDYTINGVDEDKGAIDLAFDYKFFNPKIGFTYNLNSKQQLYASYSIANKEPTRSNLVDNDVTPKQESLGDLELGFKRRSSNYEFGVNIYWMNYKDQLVLTGNLNDVGNPIQQNVPESSRTGLEIYTNIRPIPQLEVDLNATFSKNKIKSFAQSTGLYDYNFNYFGDTTIVYNDTDISFSPNLILGSTITYKPIKNLSLSWLSKYVSKQFMDNTSSNDRALDAYWLNNLKLAYTVKTKAIKAIEFGLLVNNLFNATYESNGYTYFLLFQEEGYQPSNYNAFYPQASINLLGSINIKF